MLVLGISDVEHDAAAALLDDSGTVVAIEENKLCRFFKGRGVPRLAIDRCLRQAGAEAADLAATALASRPERAWRRAESLRAGKLAALLEKSGVAENLMWKIKESQASVPALCRRT